MYENVYVPVLKWKKGEKVAIGELEEKCIKMMVPLFEIVDEYDADDLANEMIDYWPKEFYIDTSYVDAGDKHQLIDVVTSLYNLGHHGYPVFNYYDRDGLAEILPDFIEKIAFRVPVPADIDDPDTCDMISKILKEINPRNIHCDIILDLGIVTDKKEAARSYRDVKEIFDNCLKPLKFGGNVIVSLTSFPESLANMPATNELRCERFEFKIWSKIVSECTDAPFNAIYSDYGVAKFTESEIDFSKMKYGILPKARYTTFNEYWIIKGIRDQKTKEMTKGFLQIAKQICESPDYFGKNFSFGDNDIYERAYGINKKKSGNNVTWITIGTNHHLAVVLKQLSNHFGS